jgi:hypothetical protein
MIRIRLLKRKRREVKVDPHLVANGRRRRRFFMLTGQWKEKEKEKEKVIMLKGQWKEKEKVPMFRGQWNVPSLVANGR